MIKVIMTDNARDASTFLDRRTHPGENGDGEPGPGKATRAKRMARVLCERRALRPRDQSSRLEIFNKCLS